MKRASRREPLSIAGPAGRIEAEIERGSLEPEAVAVICHPHPLQQGTMNNKVVTTLARTWSRRGAAAVRFNFRGVGRSEGVFDDGRGELSDALAVIDWVAAEAAPESDLYIAGFSFGGAIAFRAAGERASRALVTVAPAISRMPLEPRRPQCDWLVVQGLEDEIVSAESVLNWCAAFEPSPIIDTMDGVGHFFHGRLGELANSLNRFLDTQ